MVGGVRFFTLTFTPRMYLVTPLTTLYHYSPQDKLFFLNENVFLKDYNDLPTLYFFFVLDHALDTERFFLAILVCTACGIYQDNLALQFISMVPALISILPLH